jgi:exopolyphosphatase / guanosine-5'-triphosphate,3'-diphosphate pyrophosphatase
MDEIIPRWEWRTFGERFGECDQRFESLVPEGVQEGDEVYLLSPVTDENVKIRDRLMDIKRLQQVNADGLEQWRPVMKAAFPLPAAPVGEVFDALGVPAPSLLRGAYTLDQLIEELIKPGGRVGTVLAHKKRAQYRIDGCLAERTEVVVDRERTRTVAIESEDPARVIAVVRDLGLGRFENTSYPRGLKRLIGMKG